MQKISSAALFVGKKQNCISLWRVLVITQQGEDISSVFKFFLTLCITLGRLTIQWDERIEVSLPPLNYEKMATELDSVWLLKNCCDQHGPQKNNTLILLLLLLASP